MGNVNEDDTGQMNKLCTSCKTMSCCTDFMPPFLTPKELALIQEKTGFSEIYENLNLNGRDVHAIKAKPGTQECVFLSSKQVCTIYDHRPFDCKIYPFDIYKINDEYTWIVYSCNPDSDWKWSEELLDKFEKTLLTHDIQDYIDAFSNVERFENPNALDYEYAVLRKVDFTKYSDASKVQKIE